MSPKNRANTVDRSLHIRLTEGEWNQLWSVYRAENYRSQAAYVTQLIRRDLYDADRERDNTLDREIPAKTPEQYEAEIKHLREVIQNLKS